MRGDQASESIHIDAAPARCYGVAIDFDRYPEWATDVKEVEVLERDGEGRGTRVRYEISALGKTIGYVLRYDYEDAPEGFAWDLEKADFLRTLEGAYRFDPDGAGTKVGYLLAVDVTLPLPGFMKRAAADMIVNNAMKQLKAYIEAGGGAA
ncbi:MAG TPA: SRPBCC family protein [Acidimicrobiia bacterium]|nr:SRPBCC family protein [Acidimicrobiia bacterium]